MSGTSRRTVIAGLASSPFVGFPARAAPPKPLRVGEIAPIAIFWPGLVATSQKFYEAEGLTVETNYVGSNTASVQQLVGGSLDLTQATCEVALQSIEKGADLSIIGATAIKYPYSMMSIAGVKTAADIKGKKVMLPVPKQDIDVFFDRWLVTNGLTPGDVDKVYDGATPNRYAALASGAVAAAAVSQPLDFRAQSEGYNTLVDFGSFEADYAFVVLLASKPWLRDNGDAARSFARALSKSIDWLYDVKNRDAAVDILSAASKQDKVIVGKTFDYYQRLMPFSRHLDLPTASVQNVANSMAKRGNLKSAQTALAALDVSFLAHR